MLFGYFLHDSTPPITKYWFQLNRKTPLQKKAIIIGAGLAGATTAWSLANRGWQITLLEKNKTVAEESSGNLQGVVYARLSAFNNVPNKFMVQAYHYSLCLLNQFYQNTQPDTWSPCGVLQLAFNDKEQKRYAELLEGDYPPDILQTITAEAATALAGTAILQNALYFPSGGWVNPPSFCKDLTTHKNITLKTSAEVTQLQFDEQYQEWHLLDAKKQVIEQAPVVIIANNTNAVAFEQTHHLPIKIIRGQITHLHSNNVSQSLKTVVCADRYLTPARKGLHNVGASFNLNEETTQIRLEDHAENIASLQTSLPDLYAGLTQQSDNLITSLQGRVGFRATTPDYMPIVGPVPIESQFIEDYAALRYDSNARVKKQGTYYPGLFINTAHGSRGLLTCPLSAELLAAHINHETVPLENEVVELLHPARFIIKDLIKRKR
jgi:tRNA 5-methylaminomethyl-2-thiouridine biosynthesis bifunctional protein